MKKLLALALLLPIVANAAYTAPNDSTPQQSPGASTQTCNLPATHNTGEQLLVAFSNGNSARTVSTGPTGYTALRPLDSGGGASMIVYGKIDSGSESAPAITWSGTGNLACQMISVPGGGYTDQSTITDASGTSNTAGANSVPTSAVTVPTDGDFIWIIATRSKTATTNGATWSAYSGFTQLTGLYANGSTQAMQSYYAIQTSHTNLSASNVTLSANESVAGRTISIALKSASVFTVNPTISSCTSTACTIGGTTGGSVTVDAVACIKGSTAPTNAQVIAHHCTGDAAAQGYQTGTWNGAASFSITGLSFPVYDFYATDQTNLVTIGSQDLACPTNYSCAFPLSTLAGGASDPITVFNAAEATDIVAGDYVRYGLTSPDSYTVTAAADGSVSLSGLPTAQSFPGIFYDVSAGGWHASATPGSPATFYSNWSAPVCSGPGYTSGALKTGTAITTITLSSICSDPQSSALTYTKASGTISTGLSLASNGNITGTPTVEAEAGDSSVITVTNAAGLTTTSPLTLFPITTLTVPNGSGQLCNDFANTIYGARGFLTPVTTYATSLTVAANNVISQTPSAATEAEPYATISFVCSLGVGGGGGFGWPRFKFGFGE